MVREAQTGDEGPKALEREAFEICLQKRTRSAHAGDCFPSERWKGSFQRWIDQLTSPTIQNIREFAEFEYDSGDKIPLWQMGFWNLVSDVLSHDAVMKLRDQGSFYHLIPENPNAVEWLVFWLRGLKTSDKLQGIEGGMSSIVNLIGKAIAKKPKSSSRSVRIEKQTTLISIGGADGSGAVRLNLIDRSGRSDRAFSVDAGHVILAIPKSPLEKIVAQSADAFPPHVATDISRAWGFPMTKVFAVVRKRWWESEHMANLYAGRVPTRELHYWKSQTTRRGMIMAYADRPGSNFWANYISRQGRQDEPDWFPVLKSWFEANRYTDVTSPGLAGTEASEASEVRSRSTPDIRNTQKRRLIYKLVEYLSAIGSQTIRPTDVEYCGIVDWGREPYGAANHTWLAETKSWIVLSQLSAFALGGGPPTGPRTYTFAARLTPIITDSSRDRSDPLPMSFMLRTPLMSLRYIPRTPVAARWINANG